MTEELREYWLIKQYYWRGWASLGVRLLIPYAVISIYGFFHEVPPVAAAPRIDWVGVVWLLYTPIAMLGVALVVLGLAISTYAKRQRRLE